MDEQDIVEIFNQLMTKEDNNNNRNNNRNNHNKNNNNYNQRVTKEELSNEIVTTSYNDKDSLQVNNFLKLYKAPFYTKLSNEIVKPSYKDKDLS